MGSTTSRGRIKRGMIGGNPRDKVWTVFSRSGRTLL
jgi:hypothetical protein